MVEGEEKIGEVTVENLLELKKILEGRELIDIYSGMKIRFQAVALSNLVAIKKILERAILLVNFYTIYIDFLSVNFSTNSFISRQKYNYFLRNMSEFSFWKDKREVFL